MSALLLLLAMAAPVEPLTLDAAMAYAREHAPAAGSAEAQAIIARARADVARTSWWPTVSGSVALGTGASNSHGLLGSEVCADPSLGVCTQSRAFDDADASAGIDVRWTVFDFGRRAASIRAAELSAEAAAFDARANGDQLAAAAAVAFLSATANEELLQARTDILERRAKALTFAEERVRIGVAPPIEATRARVSLETAKLDVATADAAVADAHASLARALGLDPGKRMRLARASESAASALDVNDDPARAADVAESKRRELESQKKRIQAAEADIDGARADAWPSIQASAGASARASGYTAQDPTAAEGANVGLVLSVPLFDLGIDATVRAAEASANAARAVERERVLAVRADAAAAALAVRAQKQALASAEILGEQAEANLAQAEGRYQAGAGSLLELVDAQTQQSSAQLSLAQARFALAIAKARLLAAMGTLGAH